jgi:ArsR family transcriptional regulator, arsenate/arsenite/antimonite-responsive transcriptional repressor
METKQALTALAALAHETRLVVFRLLVETGPEGLPVGKIGERLGLAPATLSFHLKELAHADLVTTRHEGRFIYCSANFATMHGLVAYLTDNCCSGVSTCVPGCEPEVCQPTRQEPP